MFPFFNECDNLKLSISFNFKAFANRRMNKKASNLECSQHLIRENAQIDFLCLCWFPGAITSQNPVSYRKSILVYIFLNMNHLLRTAATEKDVTLLRFILQANVIILVEKRSRIYSLHIKR
jgi:hypothetical protein